MRIFFTQAYVTLTGNPGNQTSSYEPFILVYSHVHIIQCLTSFVQLLAHNIKIFKCAKYITIQLLRQEEVSDMSCLPFYKKKLRYNATLKELLSSVQCFD